MKENRMIKLGLLVAAGLAVLLAGCGGDGGGDASVTPCTSNGNIELQVLGGSALTSLTFTATQNVLPPPAPQSVFVAYNPFVGVAAVLGGYPPAGPNPASYGMGLVQVGADTDIPLEFEATITSTALTPKTYNAVWRFVVVDINSNVLGCQDLPVSYTVTP